MANEREIDAIAADAIASSEKEFFEDAMNVTQHESDGDGDKSLETMGSGLEGQHESDEGDGEDGGEQEDGTGEEADDVIAAAKAKERDEHGRFATKPDKGAAKPESAHELGLRNELRAERDKRQALEAELAKTRQDGEARLAAIEARLAQPQPAKPVEQPKPEAKDEAPDRWLDPEGYEQWRERQFDAKLVAQRHEFEQRRVAWSFEEAKTKHGDDFAKAYAEADAMDPNDPVALQLLNRIKQSANPGEMLVQWHRQQAAVKEVGADPAGYREKVKTEIRDSLKNDPEFRKEVLAGLQADARSGNNGGPRTTVKLPPSLNAAQGGQSPRPASGAHDTSDRGLFEQVMSG
jgi:hypothetical protein